MAANSRNNVPLAVRAVRVKLVEFIALGISDEKATVENSHGMRQDSGPMAGSRSTVPWVSEPSGSIS